MATPNEILKEAMSLTPLERAYIIDKLVSSLDKPDTEIDKLQIDDLEGLSE